MSAPGSGLLDTSVFIAQESKRALGELPALVAVPVVTIGELQLGVLHARDGATRARRADTLALARSADPIPISEAIMVAWARLVADCRDAGIQRAVKLTGAPPPCAHPAPLARSGAADAGRGGPAVRRRSTSSRHRAWAFVDASAARAEYIPLHPARLADAYRSLRTHRASRASSLAQGPSQPAVADETQTSLSL